MLVAASTVRTATDLAAQLAGIVILAGTLAAIAAFCYRWYVRDAIPKGLSLLVGLSGVAVYLNTTQALGQVIGGSTLPTETEVALFNIVAFLVATGGAILGRRAGDRFGSDVALRSEVDVERDVGRLVQSVGRVITVELPADIDDVVGYDPVPEKTKEKLAGKTFVFPRRLTVEELRERLVARLKSDYAVGHVDLELRADGSVEYLALGSRAAGIGPTLPPATNAVALRADPAFAASVGDLVQVWETDPMRRVLTGELRGVAGETVTVAIDASDTPKVDPQKRYRLVTLPVDDRPGREFASLLRAADETFSSVTVEAGSPLHGMPVSALTPTIIAVKPEDGTPIALPDSRKVLAPGDVVFAIARPEALRRLDRAAEPLDPSLVQRVAEPTRRPATEPPTGTQSQSPDTAGESRGVAAGTADEPRRERPEATEPESPATATRADEGRDDGPTADTTEAADSGSVGEDAGTGAEEPETATERRDGPSGQADEESFEQLKSEFESGDADWAEEGDSTGVESDVGRESAAPSDDATSQAGGEGVDELDVGDDEPAGDFDLDDDGVDDLLDGPSDTPDQQAEDESEDIGLDLGSEDDGDGGGDGTFDFEEESGTDLDVDDGADDSGPADDPLFEQETDEPADDDLSALSVDDEDDGLDFEDELDFEDDGLDLEDAEPAGEDGESEGGIEEDEDEDQSADEDEGDDEGDDEEDEVEEDEDDEDEDDNGGGTSFQQLKEEFESGDADWADDISDSPGGDMRLDE